MVQQSSGSGGQVGIFCQLAVTDSGEVEGVGGRVVVKWRWQLSGSQGGGGEGSGGGGGGDGNGGGLADVAVARAVEWWWSGSGVAENWQWCAGQVGGCGCGG